MWVEKSDAVLFFSFFLSEKTAVADVRQWMNKMVIAP